MQKDFCNTIGTVQSTQDASVAGEEAKAGNYDKAAAHLGLGTFNAALDWLPPAKLALIGGTMAKTFPWNKLPTALKMEAAGKSAEEIWRTTGLERAADGRWTFEIPDKGYQVNPNVGERTGPKSITVAPLYEHHVHPGMQEAYPRLSNWQSRSRRGMARPTLVENRCGFARQIWSGPEALAFTS